MMIYCWIVTQAIFERVFKKKENCTSCCKLVEDLLRNAHGYNTSTPLICWFVWLGSFSATDTVDWYAECQSIDTKYDFMISGQRKTGRLC